MRWLWVDRVLELEPGRRIVGVKVVGYAEDHLHAHFAATPRRLALPLMPASLVIEGMAQTAGVLVCNAEDYSQNVILAKIALAELTRDAMPGDTLRYTATMERFDPQGASTAGVVDLLPPVRGNAVPGSEAWERIGRVDLIFSHLDRRSGLSVSEPDAPNYNFVFGESFRSLLRISGLPAPPEPEAAPVRARAGSRA